MIDGKWGLTMDVTATEDSNSVASVEETARLAATALRKECDVGAFAFGTTKELEPLEDSLGQDRAVEAVRFGVGIRHDGYNLFAIGPPGLGKYELVRRYVEERAASEPVPADWCYVSDFAASHKPRALHLPAGRGALFRDDLKQLIEDLRAAIASMFESEDYLARKLAIEEDYKSRHEEAFSALARRAGERGAALIRTPMGYAFAPARNGEVLSPETFQKLPADEQKRMQETVRELEDELQKIVQQIPQWQREQRARILELNREVTSVIVRQLMTQLRERYSDVASATGFLDGLEADIVENAADFTAGDAADAPGGPMAMLQQGASSPPSFRRYQANLIVDNANAKQAPIVYRDDPTYANLVGRIEHLAQFGALMTDFNLIKPGALHAANGGYLILDARKLVQQPMAWEALKRALKSREIRIQNLADVMGFGATVTLDPEPIPLDTKVVLIGDRMLHFLLSQYDPEFSELFKVTVDFEDRLERSAQTHALFARQVAGIVARENLKPLDAPAVGRVIDEAARMSADSERVSLHMRAIADLLSESDYWAGAAGRLVIGAEDVQKAVDEAVRRADRTRRLTLEEIQRGTILIDTAGAVVGQVNGLSVVQIGTTAFGRPSRITARVRLGKGEVVDIEREVALGGPIHSKGVLILGGFLGERFGRDQPLALSASLVFEQSYGGVDGDSASSAEIYALLSALSQTPIRQSLAVTGSVNQRGEVQAIGGANEKIEGYFDICQARGLTGEQGVLIPASNVKHLMLRKDVVDAVRAGRFNIYAVRTIDQGIELLTGVPAGAPDDTGAYPAGTVNGDVQAALKKFAERARAFTAHPAQGADT